MFHIVTKNDDGMSGQMCLAHGDLNLANVICDKRENIWVIDWTHAGIHPLELDFAKLENDVKFVISKQFQVDDFAKLEQFEEYLLTTPIPNMPLELPKALEFLAYFLSFVLLIYLIYPDSDLSKT